MSHLDMELLLALDEPGLEPAVVRAREHLDGCPECQAERDRLLQRQARMRALPTLTPARDQWPKVAARIKRERNGRRIRWASGISAIAAALLVTFVLGRQQGRDETAQAAEARLRELMARSQALEAAIGSYAPETRVLDGRTSRLAADLEDRIADLDDQLQRVDLQNGPEPTEMQKMQLWQERVGLLDALVDVHVTRASHVGL